MTDPGHRPPDDAPLLSVTVTNYNYARFLPTALDSILAQTYTDYELVVVDNASTDGSLEILREYAARDPRIRLVEHETNIGALANLRESVERCRGRYRVHVDADDWIISPTAFERQMAMVDAHPDITLVYSHLTMFGPDGAKTHVSRPFPADVVMAGEDAVEAILGFTLNHTGMLFRIDAYRHGGGYPEGLPHVDDMLLGIRLCEQGSVGYIADELYSFRQHGANVHLAPQLAVVRDEFLPVVESAFSGPLGPKLSPAVRKRIVQNTLVHLPTQYVFRGEPRAGWRLWLESAKARPVDTIVQPRTLALVARTVLGQRGFAFVADRARRR